MKNSIKLSVLTLALAVGFSACTDLDIPPKNIVTSDDLLSNDSGMEIYMSRMYSYMPFEDFKYMAQWGIAFNGWLGCTGIEGTGESVNRDGICTQFSGEDTPYWDTAFRTIRDANFLIENLPQFKGNFPEATFNHYIGEAYFVRAFCFYAMAKRFGGIPLVLNVINYPDDQSSLEVARSSEEQTWNQICKDFDEAASLLMTTSPKKGYANKYVALAWKAEAMNYAGSVAKYNEEVDGHLTGFGSKTGVRVIGFDPETWRDASKRYFTEAYKAAREVMSSGIYQLYMSKWVDGDREAQYQNMVDMFSDTSSKENIYIKEYDYPTMAHSYDSASSPFIFHSPLSAGTCPTLDFLELFEGFDRYPDGTIRVTTGNSNAEGNYILYDSTLSFFDNAEPRLRAYVIFPGDSFKGKVIETFMGSYTGTTPIQPFFADYSYNTASQPYEALPIFSKSLLMSSNTANQVMVTYNGVQRYATGANGPYYNDGEATITGLYGRKWLNADPSAEIGEGKSEQPFVLMRYADVLLAAAEAGVELSIADVESPDDSDMLQVATQNINDIRHRAGASLLTAQLKADNASRNIVRRERRKELAFEHKTKWDLRRWRVQHYQNRDGFWGEERDKDFFSDNNRYRFRGLYPFFSVETGKYFFDAHFHAYRQKTFDYTVVDYYFEIPSGEVSKSTVIDQQPNR